MNVEKNAVDLSGEAWAATVDPLAAAETSVNGKLYGQPAQDVSSVWAVAYNKKVFEKLNLSVPTNYEEFKAVCEAIKADGMTPSTKRLPMAGIISRGSAKWASPSNMRNPALPKS